MIYVSVRVENHQIICTKNLHTQHVLLYFKGNVSHVVGHSLFGLFCWILVKVELLMIENFDDAPPPSPFYIKFTFFKISVESN
jgi:hypothetical protein